MHEESVITRTIRAAPGVFAPGHLGELTQVIDFALVDAVLDETRARERRLRYDKLDTKSKTNEELFR